MRGFPRHVTFHFPGFGYRVSAVWLKIAYAGFAVALVAAVQLTVGWANLLEPWTRASPGVIGGAALLVLSTYLIRSARLFRYFRECRDMLPCIRLFLLHNAFTNFLPVYSGEVSFPILMKRYFAVSVNRSITGLLWLRYLDFHVLILIALAALWLATSWAWVGPLTVAWALLPILSLFCWGPCRQFFARFDGRLGRIVSGALETMPTSRSVILESWGWTVLNWGVKLFAFAWILTIFAPIEFADSVFAAAGGELSSIFPFNAPAGIGTYEAGIIAAVTPLGVKMQYAIIGGVNLHLFVLSLSVLGGVLAFLIPHHRALRTQSSATA